MQGEESPFDSGVRSNPFEGVKPLARVAFDWLIIEGLWQAYKRFGRNGAAVVGVCLIFIWCVIIMIPLALIVGSLSALGLSDAATVYNTSYLALVLATGITLYGGYRTYNLIQDRRTVERYVKNMNFENIADAFYYFDSRDHTVRVTAQEIVTRGMEEAPRQVIKHSELNEDDAAFVLCELLHDDSEDVRQNGILALAYFSRESPLHVAQYRDDVFAAMKYPDSVTQMNAALITGNMVLAEPRLGSEALRHLQPLCNEDDSMVRQATAMALGRVPGNGASELLRQLMNDPHPEVRQAANERQRKRG